MANKVTPKMAIAGAGELAGATLGSHWPFTARLIYDAMERARIAEEEETRRETLARRDAANTAWR